MMRKTNARAKRPKARPVEQDDSVVVRPEVLERLRRERDDARRRAVAFVGTLLKEERPA
jgi:hypothetical protein